MLSPPQFIFVVFSLGIRGGMLAYVYWQNLRMRYWAPQSRPYHTQVRLLGCTGCRAGEPGRPARVVCRSVQGRALRMLAAA